MTRDVFWRNSHGGLGGKVMNDTLIRAITKDAGILMSAASTANLVERARNIHRTLPLATAALGRTLTAAAIMGDQLKFGGSVNRTDLYAVIYRIRRATCRCAQTASWMLAAA